MNLLKIHKHTLKNLPLAVFGIPTNNFDLPDLILVCLERIQKNKWGNKVSYISTIDEKLVTDCYGWMPTTVDDPEMLTILRYADISSLSGLPLRGLAKLLGSTLSAPFNCKEFIFSLCQALNDKE